MFVQPQSHADHASSAIPTSNATSPTAGNTPNSIHTPEQRKASHSAAHGLTARSCVICRRRKVKCDKQEPCANCVKAGSECVFPAPGRAPRRPRVGGKASSEREAELLKRLRRLEGVVEELSGQVEIEAVKHSPNSENSALPPDGESNEYNTSKGNLRVVGADKGSKAEWIGKAFRIGQGPPKAAFNVAESIDGEVGRLVYDEGKSRYVSHPFWSQISDEVEEIRSMLHDQDLESGSDVPILPSDNMTDTKHQGFLMGYSSSDVDLRPLHPLPSQIPFYWQTYLDNVHPLVTLLHAPTMSKTIKEIQNNMDDLSRSTEALMFSIYFATVTTMSAEEVQTNFGLSKELLMKQYRFGVEQALARAGLLNTSELVTVQAFVIFLICVRRHDDTRFVWTMTGLAIRIAQSLGLHRDGSHFGLSPFDIEMRRRLWWQVCILDVRASEDHGSDPSIMDYTYDTEYPTSCNDVDIDPSFTDPVKVRPGVSEMTFCLIRFEICSLSRRISYIPPGSGPLKSVVPNLTFDDKERIIKESAEMLEETYLKHCANAGPLYWVAATVARLITAKMTLILYHPLTQPGKKNDLSQDTRDRLFMSSIEIIEYSRILQQESSTRHWGWLFATYVQWHAMAYLLGELAMRNKSMIAERGWKVINGVFNDWGSAVIHGKSGTLWKPLKRLMVQARRKRETYDKSVPSNTDLELGILVEYFRPIPSGFPGKIPELFNVSRYSSTSGSTPQTLESVVQQPIPSAAIDKFLPDTAMVYPQVNGMGTLGPDQVAQQMQYQQQPPLQNTTPWLMDDSALLDLDMEGLEGEVNWEGWDDLVRDFTLNPENQMEDLQRGPHGGMGSWW